MSKAGKTMAAPKTEQQVFTALRDFSVASMQWCAAQSEQETSQIYDVLNSVIADASRRAKVSVEVLDALKSVAARAATLQASGSHGGGIQSLVAALNNVSKEHEELRRLTDPIIEALQFQDRLRQNLDNIGKLMTVWVEARAEAAVSSRSTDVDAHLLGVGDKLLKCMTSEDERLVVRKMIPGLPEAAPVVDEISLF